ncbi:MAG: hypothetical protein HXL14_04120 [Parvimonas sp.]|jgi:hypothetical protein|nr:hypothetical protein [Parvimonas sp.]
MNNRTKKDSFLIGIGRLFDITGSVKSYDIKKYTERKDIHNISGDFTTIGKDMKGVINGIRQDKLRERFS